MGTHLVEILAKNKIETVVTSRKKQTKVLDYVNYFQADAMDISSIEVLLEDSWDAIVDFMVYKTSSFKERIERLLNATEQYIFLSSARVYADSKLPISELSPRLLDTSKDEEYLASDEYAITKARQEDILINSGRKNWTIVRPYITYSENRLQLGVLEKEAWLYRALHGRSIVFSKDIADCLTTLTYGRDVAFGISKLLGGSKALGETFHIINNESITWKSVLDLYLNSIEVKLGFRPNIVYCNLEEFSSIHTGKFQILYDRLFNRVFNPTKVFHYFEKDELMKVDIGLPMCLDSFLDNPDFLNINWKLEAIKDKLTNERTSLSEIKDFKSKIKYLVYRYFI